jgi:hypothetical protein
VLTIGFDEQRLQIVAQLRATLKRRIVGAALGTPFVAIIHRGRHVTSKASIGRNLRAARGNEHEAKAKTHGLHFVLSA